MMNYEKELELFYGVEFFRSLPESKRNELVYALKTLLECKVKYKRGGATYEINTPTNIVEEGKSKGIKSDPKKIPEIDITIKRSLEYDNKKVKSAQSAVNIFREFWTDQGYQTQEHFYVLLLNRQNGVIAVYEHSKGGIAQTVADNEMICATAIKALASGVIVCHNHPSGTLQFSQSDFAVTKKLGAALKTVDIILLDHIIVVDGGDKAFRSMTDNDEMPSF
jgi:DNA repair protein RadC